MTLHATLALFLLLPLAAGALVQFSRPGANALRLLLAFSGSFLLSVALTHMMPELYEAAGEGIGPWLLGGFMLQVVLEFFSHGIEHGHMHTSPGRALPLLTLLSLCLHSFTEGMPFADARVHGDVPFLLGVLLHKLPMAIALATVLQRSQVPLSRSWTMITVFALAAPAGILVGSLGGGSLGEEFLHRALAVAIGMLLHIGTTIIFETTPEHRFNLQRFAAVLLGAALALWMVH
ncbi:MAG TPA: ZIP family metal transporter [Flavobacteriales bacterium]|mgnify:CR=1 FL=1|nr:ZIP family metal transporter [Flavobacteriales bacterium]HQW86415.1 ZIP family metal transporter [Flavobacteriales bacterium]